MLSLLITVQQSYGGSHELLVFIHLNNLRLDNPSLTSRLCANHFVLSAIINNLLQGQYRHHNTSAHMRSQHNTSCRYCVVSDQ